MRTWIRDHPGLAEGTRRDGADLGALGSVEVRTGAEIAAPVWSVHPAILIRWRGAPRSARMNQTVGFRGFLHARTAEYHGFAPRPPATDIRTPAGTHTTGQHFELSPPLGPLRWFVDALHDTRRRDPDRAYVTDESYSISDRVGDTITYYDCPKLWFTDGRAIVRANGGSSSIAWIELLGRFRTFLWVDEQRVALVDWVCTWRGTATSPDLPQLLPTYESVQFYTGPPSDGPGDAEMRRMIRAWQREDLALPRPR